MNANIARTPELGDVLEGWYTRKTTHGKTRVVHRIVRENVVGIDYSRTELYILCKYPYPFPKPQDIAREMSADEFKICEFCEQAMVRVVRKRLQGNRPMDLNAGHTWSGISVLKAVPWSLE